MNIEILFIVMKLIGKKKSSVPKESVQGYTNNGNQSLVEITLAGRNEAHKSENNFTSINVEIKNGPLIYGLKRFALSA